MDLRLWLRHRGKGQLDQLGTRGRALVCTGAARPRHRSKPKNPMGNGFISPVTFPPALRGREAGKLKFILPTQRFGVTLFPSSTPARERPCCLIATKPSFPCLTTPWVPEHKSNCQGDAIWFSPCTTSWCWALPTWLIEARAIVHLAWPGRRDAEYYKRKPK